MTESTLPDRPATGGAPLRLAAGVGRPSSGSSRTPAASTRSSRSFEAAARGETSGLRYGHTKSGQFYGWCSTIEVEIDKEGHVTDTYLGG